LYVKKNVPRITTTSVIAVVSYNGFVATRQVNGSFNTVLFGEFIESLQLQKGTVILLDNVAFHHSKVGKNIAERKGFELLFVPPYSPWFNPIEGLFSVVKNSFYKGSTIQTSFDNVSKAFFPSFFNKSLNANERW